MEPLARFEIRGPQEIPDCGSGVPTEGNCGLSSWTSTRMLSGRRAIRTVIG